MRSMTSNFTALGTQMTKAITLPILGVGAMAIKSAADLEKMEVSFISLTGGAKQAADMMEQLNEFTAKTPFQIEAVATSARQLIASGTKISEVNEQLQFLGDIAATTGQPINEIAAIFAKVNAKGKVELENLNQLAERGVGIFEALTNATGLLPSELGAGAVSVEQFNATLKSFNEEGGIAEGAMDKLSKTASGKFSTALDNLKLAGAALAEDLLPIVNKLLDKIVELAQSFSALSDTTKKNILIIASLVATIGPLLIAVPKLIALFSGAGGLSVVLSALAGPLGFVIAGLGALYLENKKVSSTLETANKAVRSQSSEVRHLVKAYRNEEKSLEDRERILKRLQEIDSTHFSNLNAENTKYSDLIKNLDEYTKSLRKSYLEKAFAAKGEKLFKEIAKQEERILEVQGEVAQHQEDIEEGKWFFYHAQAENKLKYEKSQLKKLLKAVEDFEENKLNLLKKYADDAPPLIGGNKGGLIEVVAPKQMELLDALPPKLIAVKKPIQELQESTINLGESITTLSDKTIVLAEAFGQAFGDMAAGAKTGAEAFKSFAINSIRSLIAIAKANVITNATSPANPANIASGGLAAPAFALAGLSALDALLANIPALAEGGLAYGPTLAMVGDNRGANIDPEVVAPLSKLKDLMGGNAIQVYGRISGDDIVISNNRASRDRNRF